MILDIPDLFCPHCGQVIPKNGSVKGRGALYKASQLACRDCLRKFDYEREQIGDAAKQESFLGEVPSLRID